MVKPLTYGRMGNFLFQAATAMAYAWKHGMEYTLPDTTKNPRNNPIYLQHLVKKGWDPRLAIITLTEGSHAFNDLPFQEEWRSKNIVLDGYWQTEKYFKHCRDRILEEFGFPWESLKGFVSVHVRRTDYLTLTKKHPFISKQWIDNAMARFPGYHFIFFSDDIAWCKVHYGKRSDVTCSEGKNEQQDLIYMSHCEHHICSASTFSWWGAWLNRNPDKRIIMPREWFTAGWGGLDTSDIVPPEWERM